MDLAYRAPMALALAGLLLSPLLASAYVQPQDTIGETSPTLLLDLNVSLPNGPDTLDGEAQVRGVALGRLWLNGSSIADASPVFTVSGPGAVPEPFPLPESPLTAAPGLSLRGMVDLGQGRALLFLNAIPTQSTTTVFATDGTLAGTVDLGLSYGPAQDPTDPANFQLSVNVPGRGYFVGGDANGTEGIWATDGTPGGTSLLVADPRIPKVHVLNGSLIYERRINSFPAADELFSVPELGGAPSLLLPATSDQPAFEPVEFGGRLLFAWRDQPAPGGTGVELWSTDGTTAGTNLLVDIFPGQVGSTPVLLASTGSFTYFSAITEAEGRELWRTDGTAAGTQLIADLIPGPASNLAGVLSFALAEDRLVFRMPTPTQGIELFASDGTLGGTVLLADLLPGSGSSP
jgi:ELWxxDGT repeat protein